VNRRNPVLCLDAQTQQQLLRVASAFGLDPASLFLRRKFARLIDARWTFFLLLRDRGWRLGRIATLFGFHHATVSHGFQAVQDRIDTDSQFASTVEQLRECARVEELPVTWLRVLVFAEDPELAKAAERALRARRARDAITKMGVDTPPPKLKATGGTPQRTLFGDRCKGSTAGRRIH
jgi:hypothetical protein